MSAYMITATRRIQDYIWKHSIREPKLLARLRAETWRSPWRDYDIPPVQAQFMALLVQAIGAKRCLEIGTLAGYSALVVALALPRDGKLITCDIDKEMTDIARRYWKEAGVAGKIELRLAPALDTMDALLAKKQAGRFDFVFIDADKINNDAYYERALKLLRPGGIVAIDNALWGGSVLDTRHWRDRDTRAIRALNRKIHRDERVTVSMLPVGDGLTLACKRG